MFLCEFSEAVVRRCSLKKVLLEISQNSQENMCQSLFFNKVEKETLAQLFSCEFCENSKNTFFDRTPLVAASEFCEISKNNFSYRTPPVVACDLIFKDSMKDHNLFFTLAIFRWPTVTHWANSIWNHFHLVCQT